MTVAALGFFYGIALDVAPAHAQLVAGPNANVVGGPACVKQGPDDPCPFQVFGDVSIQRQNEGSMACSSRNPQTCLAAGNDYRLINLPGVADGKVTADAWLGLYWTRNGGQSWRSTLLPGWKTSDPDFHDTTPQGQAGVNPIAGFEAAADPTLRAGTHGLLYLSGIAFNRSEETTGANTSVQAGGEGKSGVQFASVFIDDNDTADPNKPPRYLRTTVVDAGTNGRFLDKPWVISDKPRGQATCTIPAGPGVPGPQTIQAGMVYIAYATFLGSGNNPHSDIWVRSSNNCGETWSAGTKVTQSVPLNQSPIIVVNPTSGALYVVWREFGQSGSADRILMASSTNSGRTFGKVTEVANLGVPTQTTPDSPAISTAFDQTTLPNDFITTVRMTRTNGYPAACVGTDGVLRVAYSQRITQSSEWAVQYARIMYRTLTGSTWSPPRAIDNHLAAGHQFQPSIACTGSGSTAIWYDQRNDLTPLMPWVFTPYILDPIPTPPAHTVDVRAVQTDAAGQFQPGTSIQVSKYPIAYDSASNTVIQLQFNFLNWPLFGGGRVPFLGDYLEVVPKNPFTPPLCQNAACTQTSGWQFNDYARESPLANGLWTDNRDVLQVKLSDSGGIDWDAYAAPGSACTVGQSLTWTRNQNLYTALLGAGFVMQAEGNARRTQDLEKRAYVVQMQNLVRPTLDSATKQPLPTTLKKRFKLTFAPFSGQSSFNFATDFTSLTDAEFVAEFGRAPVPVKHTIYVDVPYASGIARTVFVRKDETSPVVVLGEEVKAFQGEPGSLVEIPIESCYTTSNCSTFDNNLKSRTIIAPDRTAAVQELTEESHDALFGILPVLVEGSTTPVEAFTYPAPTISTSLLAGNSVFSNNLLNPTWTSPTWTSPTWTSPTWTSPTWTSPTWTSPTWTSPTWTSPTWTSPTWTSPTWTSPTWTSSALNVTEASYVAEGTGTVTSGYDLQSIVQSLPAGAIMQLVVSKVITIPGTDTCDLKNQVVLQPVANVTSLAGIADTSFSLAPGEHAVINLRVACAASNGACFNPTSGTQLVLTKQAPDCRLSDASDVDLDKCDLPRTRYDVIDHIAPMIKFSPAAPDNELNGTSAVGGAQVSWSATAADAGDALLGGGVSASCSFRLGDALAPSPVITGTSGTHLFPFGTTTITCTSTDSHNNTTTNEFTIVVKDSAPPVVTVPADANVEATSANGAIYSFTVTAVDAVDGALTPVCAPASGSTFPLGATTVTCTATDAGSNAGSGSFTVTVVDTVAPVLTLPSPAFLQATSAAGAVYSFTAIATDAVSGSVTPVCTPASGATFPLGGTTVTCTATDGASNSASGTFVVTVADKVAPVVSVPANVTVQASSGSGAVYSFTTTALDAVSGSVAPLCTPTSGATFPLGATTVTCTATDSASNTGSATFVVTVVDTTSPVVTVPSNVTVQAVSASGAAYSFTASAVDSVSGSLVATCSPASGSTFPLGATTVTCTATDSASNSGTASFVVTVVDTAPPVVTVPSSVTVQAASPAGAPYSFTTTAVDAISGTLTSGCSPASGSTFPLGATTVTCSATDAASNTGSGTFVVTVIDTIAPVLTVPANMAVITINGAATASVTYSASATDLGQALTVPCTSSAGAVNSYPATQVFPMGSTTVTCSANDGRGNTASRSFTVTVAPSYGIVGPLNPYQAPPKTYNPGSSIPIVWKFTTGGVVVDSPSQVSRPAVRFVKVLNWGRNCSMGGTESTAAQDTFANTDSPGNSFFQYFGASNPHSTHGAYTWQFNWTTPAQPTTCWSIYVGSLSTGQSTRIGRLQLK